MSLLMHEEVVVRRGRRSGVYIVVAIHSTVLGPALGGVLTRQSPRQVERSVYQPLLDAAADWHEQMVHDGVADIGPGTLAVPHELSDFQSDFLAAKREVLAARRQLAAAGKAVF